MAVLYVHAVGSVTALLIDLTALETLGLALLDPSANFSMVLWRMMVLVFVDQWTAYHRFKQGCIALRHFMAAHVCVVPQKGRRTPLPFAKI